MGLFSFIKKLFNPEGAAQLTTNEIGVASAITSIVFFLLFMFVDLPGAARDYEPDPIITAIIAIILFFVFFILFSILKFIQKRNLSNA